MLHTQISLTLDHEVTKYRLRGTLEFYGLRNTQKKTMFPKWITPTYGTDVFKDKKD